jgi:hypothetical protein
MIYRKTTFIRHEDVVDGNISLRKTSGSNQDEVWEFHVFKGNSEEVNTGTRNEMENLYKKERKRCVVLKNRTTDRSL